MYYHDLNSELRRRFGCKVYKISLATGGTCPNRDGTCGIGGCIFCDGAGYFAAHGRTVAEQLHEAKARITAKAPVGSRYIAYFQDFTATYAPLPLLRERFTAALEDPEVVALSVATRPDCLPDEVLQLLRKLQQKKPVWVELGLQTIHEQTARWIHRGYTLSVFDHAVQRLKSAGLEVVVHLILGLPVETEEMMLQSVEYVGKSGIDGIKLHLLHVLSGTPLAEAYQLTPFSLPSMQEYIALLERCLERLPREVVIHRLTGDGAKANLIAPVWTADKKRVLNAIHAAFQAHNLEQGSAIAKIQKTSCL